MKNNRFDFLRRKHIGKSRLANYELIFHNLTPHSLVDLEESDLIIDKLSTIVYPYSEAELIMKTTMKTFIDSSILNEVYRSLSNSICYTFTDDYLYCGLCMTNSKQAISESFNIAKRDNGNTCFILETNFSFYLVINYYDVSHCDYPDSFEVNLKRMADK